MRAEFVRTLVEIAELDPRVLFLTGDLGFAAVEPFFERFPERSFNVGVAEQNMLGLATGLAESGFIPFVYSIATFASLRPYEFLRNGPILHQLPVRVVGVGGGFEYGHAGPTHYAVDDVGVLRVQPGLMVISPADYQQTSTALRATWNLPIPIYYRLGKNDSATVPGLNGRFDPERVECIRTGSDVAIVATGGIAGEAAAAADLLWEKGITASMFVAATLNPAPADDLAEELSRFPVVLTVEAHFVVGGLGSLVSEVIAEHGLSCRLVRCAVRSTPDGITGDEGYMNHRYGLSREALVQTALGALAPVRA